jgi:Ca2+-binding RTX toxin-like protein
MTFSSIIVGLDFDFALMTEGNDFLAYETVSVPEMEVLLTSVGTDAIVLLAGDDTASDDSSSRIYFGNLGNDSIKGNQGSDTLAGGQGNDILEGNLDNDVLFGNIGNDTVRGGDGRDVIFGGKNEDVLVGLSGDDLLYGDLGDDLMLGGDGNDTLTGGDGTDVFVIDAPGLGVDVIMDFSTSETSVNIAGIDDKIRLPFGIAFENILLQKVGESQTAVSLASTGQTLAILEDILPSAISSANFTLTLTP